MGNCIGFALAEGAVLLWVVAAVRSRLSHEIAVSIGYFLFVAMCFENFGGLLPFSYWRLDGPAVLRVIGFALLGVSAALAIATFLTLKRLGRPKGLWEDTTELIERGVFSRVRHPMYLAASLAAVGVLLTRISLVSLPTACVANLLFFLGAWHEDRWNEGKFGEAYKRYKRHTRLFVPFVW